MKKTGIFITSLILITIVLLTIEIVFNALTGGSIRKELTKSIGIKKPSLETNNIVNAGSCSASTKNEKINQSEEKHLVQIAKYQDICKSHVTNKVMIFETMPKDSIEAKEKARLMSDTLKDFKSADVTPIIIVEPVTTWGLTDFKEFEGGFYDAWLKEYFRELKIQNVTGDMMGVWVPFPEANLPYWNHANATPSDFATVVNKYLTILKSEYPEAKGSILLNSATYETDDFDWINGEYLSLRQYVEGLNKNLIDSVGLQGLPWVSAANDEPNSVFNPAEFLNHKLAEEMAAYLEVRDIWFNTGTFGAKYTIDSEKLTTVSADKRKDILNGILFEAIKLRDLGYNVTINLFVQDKSNTAEATDWSYLSNSYSGSSETENVFVEFVSKSYSNNIDISLFDRLD